MPFIYRVIRTSSGPATLKHLQMVRNTLKHPCPHIRSATAGRTYFFNVRVCVCVGSVFHYSLSTCDIFGMYAIISGGHGHMETRGRFIWTPEPPKYNPPRQWGELTPASRVSLNRPECSCFSTLLTKRTIKRQRPIQRFIQILLCWAATAPCTFAFHPLYRQNPLTVSKPGNNYCGNSCSNNCYSSANSIA